MRLADIVSESMGFHSRTSGVVSGTQEASQIAVGALEGGFFDKILGFSPLPDPTRAWSTWSKILSVTEAPGSTSVKTVSVPGMEKLAQGLEADSSWEG